VIEVGEVMASLDTKRKVQKQKPEATWKVAPGLWRLGG